MTNRLYQWIETFPTTNGKVLLGMLLTTLVVVAGAVCMVRGVEISEGVLALLLGGTLTLSGIAAYQKVQKWREMPASGEEEPAHPSTP